MSIIQEINSKLAQIAGLFDLTHSGNNRIKCPKCKESSMSKDYSSNSSTPFQEYKYVGVYGDDFVVDYEGTCDDCGYKISYHYKNIALNMDQKTGREWESLAVLSKNPKLTPTLIDGGIVGKDVIWVKIIEILPIIEED